MPRVLYKGGAKPAVDPRLKGVLTPEGACSSLVMFQSGTLSASSQLDNPDGLRSREIVAGSHDGD